MPEYFSTVVKKILNFIGQPHIYNQTYEWLYNEQSSVQNVNVTEMNAASIKSQGNLLDLHTVEIGNKWNIPFNSL